MSKSPITSYFEADKKLPMARSIPKAKYPSVQDVLAAAQEICKVGVRTLKSKDNRPQAAPSRHIAMFIAAYSCKKTLDEIAAEFGPFDRTAVSYARRATCYKIWKGVENAPSEDQRQKRINFLRHLEATKELLRSRGFTIIEPTACELQEEAEKSYKPRKDKKAA
ncbi:helix-turn-helix domain-containing protein [Roseibium aggregatum]|uniref:Chromosomal replication initiator protein DnaA n=1 Tax=Roseibium aggregatum TaxID=187304 RepID=A0A0M6YCC3_9HYPH|nr:helix-turn-helix domain-containing protein [Roseibium aggregatum]CTQ47328.1 chromosomal replication initiator protein DnaA [Roseibium aggregatum]